MEVREEIWRCRKKQSKKCAANRLGKGMGQDSLFFKRTKFWRSKYQTEGPIKQTV